MRCLVVDSGILARQRSPGGRISPIVRGIDVPPIGHATRPATIDPHPPGSEGISDESHDMNSGHSTRPIELPKYGPRVNVTVVSSILRGDGDLQRKLAG